MDSEALNEREQKLVDVKAGISTGRAFDRLINMSDAIVAVAMTVNVLSIVGIRRNSYSEGVWTVISENGGQIGSFCFTFLIVGVMWLAHNRILNHMRGYDSTTFWLNLVWLLLIAILPWPTTMYGVSLVFGNADVVSDQAGVGLFYWGTLAAISAVGGLIGLHARRRPALLDQNNPPDSHGQLKAWIYSGFFLLIGLISLVSYSISTWLPVGLIVLAVVFRRSRAS